jgi:hypothetical protein
MRMKKKILIGVGVFVVLVVVGMIYLNHRNRTLSPPGTTEYSSEEFRFWVDYSRPSVRGRLIFGTEQEDALQPYGQYWRLGANEGTEFECTKNFVISGNVLKAGRYRIYAVPGPEEFEVFISSEIGEWGAFEPDHSNDLFSFKVTRKQLEEAVEQFTCRINSVSDNELEVIFDWNKTSLVIPVEIKL